MRYFLIVLLFALTLTSCRNFGTKLTFKKGELYYTNNVTKEDAQKLGDYFVSQNFFDNDKAITVQLDKRHDTILVRVPVKDSVLNSASYEENMAFMGGAISRSVFNMKPVAVDFCDDNLKTEKTVFGKDFGASISVQGNDLFYTDKVTKEETQKLGDYLQQQNFFVPGNTVTIQLDKLGNTYLFRYVVKASALQDESLVAAMQSAETALSNDVFNHSPVVIQLCNDHLVTQKVIPPITVDAPTAPVAASSSYGTKLSFAGNDLYYTGNVTVDEANRLGAYLQDQGFFTTEKHITTQLDKDADTYLFRFVVLDNYLNSDEYAQNAKTFAKNISESVFNMQPVAIHFCDDELQTKKVIKP